MGLHSIEKLNTNKLILKINLYYKEYRYERYYMSRM